MDGNCSFWVNVYVNGVSSSFLSRDQADSAPYPKSRIAVAEFVIKGKNLEDVIYHPINAPDCNPGHLTIMVNGWERSRKYLLQRRPIRSSKDYEADGISKMTSEQERQADWEAYISACEKDG